jgi:hypothetical protein
VLFTQRCTFAVCRDSHDASILRVSAVIGSVDLEALAVR